MTDFKVHVFTEEEYEAWKSETVPDRSRWYFLCHIEAENDTILLFSFPLGCEAHACTILEGLGDEISRTSRRRSQFSGGVINDGEVVAIDMAKGQVTVKTSAAPEVWLGETIDMTYHGYCEAVSNG